MKKLILKFALASLCCSALQIFNELSAQNIVYLLSDKLCVNKFDYQEIFNDGIIQSAQSAKKDIEFFDFNVYFSNTNKLLLRVPKIDNVHIAKFKTLDPTATVLKCSDLDKVDATFIDKVNSYQSVLYVLEANPEGGYIGFHVNEIIQLTDTEKTFAYKDKRYNFTLDKRANYDKKTNLNASNLNVNLDSKGKDNCFDTYNFRVSSVNSSEQASTFYFTEGIGLTKISAPNGVVELKTVNGLLSATHVKTLCDVKQVVKTPLADRPVEEKDKKKEIAELPSSKNPQPTGKSRSLFDPQAPVAAKTTITEPVKEKTSELPAASTITENKPANNNEVASRGLGKAKSIPNPPKEVPPGFHLVKEGDNLYKIAQEYFTTVNHIKHWNNLKNDAIMVNQLLKVVDDGYNNYKGANPSYIEKNGTRYIVHKVEQNDVLGSISKKYKVLIKDLYQWNNLQSDFLQIGQELIVGEEQL